MLKNSIENKAMFFALYLGQQVLCYNAYPITSEILPGNGYVSSYLLQDLILRDDKHAIFYLELTPVSQISDEDAIEVVSLLKDFGLVCSAMIEPKKYLLSCNPNSLSYMIAGVVDHLRSKGYAVPWMGLSIEDLIRYGWMKLKL